MWYRFLLVIIIFVTAVGNMLVCLAIARERKLQNTTNYFLMSLAVADCLVAVLVMPMGMIAEVLGHFPLPHYACIIFATIDVLCCTSSIWHMSTMSMDRYFTIRFPFRYGRNKTRRIMLLKIIAVWAISTAISSPVFVLGIVDKQNVLSNGVCAPNNASFKLYGSVFAFYIPFIIMITTYALTMRSLRNVLVNKRNFNRERRRKQVFQPITPVVNQYSEMVQNITHASTTDNLTVASDNNNNNISNNYRSKSRLNSTPYALLTFVSSKDSRPQNSLLNSLDLSENSISKSVQYGSMSMANGTNMNNELIQNNNQHLTINYVKRNVNRKRSYQQQQQTLIINTEANHAKHNLDMNTVFEIDDCFKSAVNSHSSEATINNNCVSQRLMIADEHKQQQEAIKIMDNQEKQREPEASNAITSISAIGTKSKIEVDIYLTTDIDSEKSFIPTESLFLTIPWQNYFTLIRYILQYYIFIYPYQLRPLSIKYELKKSELKQKSFKLHQSTSTSSINPIVIKKSQTVSTQTNLLPPIDTSNVHTTNVNETHTYNRAKLHNFSFNRSILSSSSFFGKFFRQTSTAISDSYMNSNKSSASLEQHSQKTSSSDPTRQQHSYHHIRHHHHHNYQQHHSSNVFRPIEFETDHSLDNDLRLRASSSSSALLRTTYQRRNHASLRCHKPLKHRQPFQSRSAYFLTYSNSRNLRQQQQKQPFSSSANTNSSDSLSVFHRLNSKYFSNMSHQQQNQNQLQHIRDEHIVAANERKALRVLLIIFCVFVSLWTPFFICTFISAICEQCREHISSNVWLSITWLGYSSSMANPFIYTIFSDVFRRAFTNIIFCRPSDSLFPRQFSSKLPHQKSVIARPSIHQQLSNRRSQNPENSRTSTPISLHRQTSIGGSEATIYINRCISDTFR